MSATQDNDAELQSAGNVLRADYYRSVRATAEDFVRRMRGGEWDDEESCRDALREELDQTYWSIYTHAAYQCLSYSDNDSEAWEEAREYGTTLDGHELICLVASISHRLDVEETIGSDIEEHFASPDEE